MENINENIEWYEEEERKIYPIDSDKITSSVTTYDIFNLASNIKREKIEIQPIYQRTYVWDNLKAEKFIDSLWNNLPIPPLFFLAKKDWNFMVIDWQQRLTSLLKFVLSSEDIIEYVPSMKNIIKTKSRKLSVSWKIFKLDDKSYFFEELPEEIQRNFENKEINLVIIKPNYSIINENEVDEIIKEIFYRLNTWWVKLSDQEIRQSLYTWTFMNKLKEYSFWNKWNLLLPKNKKFTENPSLLTEALLRWFAFLDIYWEKNDLDSIWIDLSYSKPLWDFLGKYAKYTEKFSDTEVEERFFLVEKIVSLLVKIEDSVSVFKHKKGVKNPKSKKSLNKSVNIKYIDTLLVWLLNLFRKIDTLEVVKLENIINEFKENKDIIDHIVRWWSSDSKYVKERVEKSIELVEKLYHKFNT